MWTRTLLIVPALLTTGCASMLANPYGVYGRQMGNPYAMRPAAVAPLPIGRWDNVMRVPPDSTLAVAAMDGMHTGVVVGADAQTVVLREGSQEARISRSNVIRIDVVDLAGSEAGAVAAGAAKGAVLGAGAAALIGAVAGGRAWPPRGPWLRGPIALGAVAGGAAAVEQRREQMIYLAPFAAGGRAPYGGYGPYPGDGRYPPDDPSPAYDPYQYAHPGPGTVRLRAWRDQ